MPLKMVYHNNGLPEGKAEGLGEGCSDQKGAQKTRATGEGYGLQLISGHSRPVQSLTYYRDYILFVGPGGEFRHHPAEVLMDLLAGDYVGQKVPVTYDGGRCVVARRLDS